MELTKIECALACTGIRRYKKRVKEGLNRFENNLERGYYADKTEKEINKIKRNKRYKIRVCERLLEKFEQLLTEEEIDILMKEHLFDLEELKFESNG